MKPDLERRIVWGLGVWKCYKLDLKRSMRLHLTLSKNRIIVPFDHLPALVGTLQKWLGHNEWHNQLALYSFSQLIGAQRAANGLDFSREGKWFISSANTDFIKRVVSGIQNDPIINYGMAVTSITIQETPAFKESHSFTLASPVLIKRKEGQRVKHYLFSDHQANGFMTETLVTKLKKAGLKTDGAAISFNKDYPFPKTKLINYNGIGNRASICPVTISGTPEQIAFAWNVGIGNSTGIGFGALN